MMEEANDELHLRASPAVSGPLEVGGFPPERGRERERETENGYLEAELPG